ncbi:nucleoside monophosphate kinase [Candidatus Woesearchaeota archaeon]|nr:nucleoside monophosphate kinase [Candidatus Woesearchaeota archaeon]MCF8012983.1 nucleoside monophosphate kinase [Candidatus Woesearchaeota archaeon]
MNKPKAAYLFGVTNAGKDSVAEILLKKTNTYTHLSTGKIIREYAKNTPVYLKNYEQKYKESAQGNLLADEIMNETVKYAMRFDSDKFGYESNKILLLNGYPRTQGQVKNLNEIFESMALFHVIPVSNINNKEELEFVVLNRAKERMKIENRPDNNIDKIKENIKTFYDEILPAGILLSRLMPKSIYSIMNNSTFENLTEQSLIAHYNLLNKIALKNNQ